MMALCYTRAIHHLKGYSMFESIEVRKAANGFILVVHTQDEDLEYVYDSSRKAMRIIKQYLEADAAKSTD